MQQYDKIVNQPQAFSSQRPTYSNKKKTQIAALFASVGCKNKKKKKKNKTVNILSNIWAS